VVIFKSLYIVVLIVVVISKSLYVNCLYNFAIIVFSTTL
jgi:hypothetical protein